MGSRAELALVSDRRLLRIRGVAPEGAEALWSPRAFFAEPFKAARLLEKMIDDVVASGLEAGELDGGVDPPVTLPSKIIGLGRNYAMHAVEMGGKPLPVPDVFLKAPSALVGHMGVVEVPWFVEKPDYEGEIVVVVGRRLRMSPRAEARASILGYAAGMDITARDIQYGERRRPWSMAKSIDTFAPLGPYLTIIDDYEDLEGLCLETRLNSETMQKGCVDDMVFRPDEILVHVSRMMTLYPGDLIYTGTPPGVGHARSPPVYLSDGDVLEVELRGEHPLRLSVRRLAEPGRQG